MKTHLIPILSTLLISNGCTSVRQTMVTAPASPPDHSESAAAPDGAAPGLAAVYPKMLGLTLIEVANEISPEFTWADPSAPAGTTYVFGLWEVLYSVKTKGGATDKFANIHDEVIRGELLLTREDIAETSCRIDYPFKPDMPYFWSVKRTGSPGWSMVRVNERGVVHHSAFLGNLLSISEFMHAVRYGSGYTPSRKQGTSLYLFKTPPSPTLAASSPGTTPEPSPTTRVPQVHVRPADACLRIAVQTSEKWTSISTKKRVGTVACDVPAAVTNLGLIGASIVDQVRQTGAFAMAVDAHDVALGPGAKQPDYSLEVLLDIHAAVRLFSEGYIIDIPATWRLIDNATGAQVLSFEVLGHGRSRKAGSKAHRDAFQQAIDSCVQEGVTRLAGELESYAKSSTIQTAGFGIPES